MGSNARETSLNMPEPDRKSFDVQKYAPLQWQAQKLPGEGVPLGDTDEIINGGRALPKDDAGRRSPRAREIARWTRFARRKVRCYRAEDERDADPLRKARLLALRAASDTASVSLKRLSRSIGISNAAKLKSATDSA